MIDSKTEKMLEIFPFPTVYLKAQDRLTHYHTMPHFDAPKIYSCGKHCEKKEKLLVTIS